MAGITNKYLKLSDALVKKDAETAKKIYAEIKDKLTDGEKKNYRVRLASIPTAKKKTK